MPDCDPCEDLSGLPELEHKWLRGELRDLKECQVRYIFYTVVATGALLGLAGSVNFGDSMKALSPLFALVIVLPFWWIFFDKARVITRAVGYYRKIEEAIIHPGQESRLFGYERSLKRFRSMQDGNDKSGKRLEYKESQDFGLWESFTRLLLLRTSHTYWVLVYGVFFVLSSLCLLLSYLLKVEGWALLGFLVAAVGVVVSVVCNWKLMWRLIYGPHSYDTNEDFWGQVLKVMRDEA